MRRTGDMGLIHGPAGVGKTCGAELFCRDNPNTLFITAKKYACGKARRREHALSRSW
jgi:DNA transposition AAA+ family ATPase